MVKVYLKGGAVGWYGKSDKYKDHRRQQRRDKKRVDRRVRAEAEFEAVNNEALLAEAYEDFYRARAFSYIRPEDDWGWEDNTDLDGWYDGDDYDNDWLCEELELEPEVDYYDDPYPYDPYPYDPYY